MTHKKETAQLAARTRRLCVMTSLFVCVVATHAQPSEQCEARLPTNLGVTKPTWVQVTIVVTGDCVPDNNIKAIINGDETDPRPLDLKLKDGEYVATFPWADSRKIRFPDARARLFASLRFERSRTYCQWSTQGKPGDKMEPVALFKFPCDNQHVHQVDIDTVASKVIPLTYARRIGMSPIQHDDTDCDSCIETGGSSGSTRVRSLWAPNETLLLQFGLRGPDSKAAGLLVFSAALTTPGVFAFATSPKGQRLLVAGPKIGRGKSQGDDTGLAITLTREDIRMQLFVKLSAKGDLPVAANDIYVEVLKALDSVSVKAVAK